MASLIIRYSEISLKGDNRQHFEHLLLENIRQHLRPYGRVRVSQRIGYLLVESEIEVDTQMQVLQRLPGIANISSASYAELSLESMQTVAKDLVARQLLHFNSRPVTFKVSAKRTNKRFPQTSEEVGAILGAFLIEAFPGQLKVKLTQPELELGVEIWDKQCALYTDRRKGVAGLPVNENQKVISLLSGGIDSPVASWMLMKRGCHVVFLYFHSFPFIGEQSKEKVIDLVKQLSHTQPQSRLYIAPFAEIQKAIKIHCPEKLRTVLYRRQMNLIANRIAEAERARALVTGDSLAQVASQTLDNLYCINENAAYPMFRPLIGMDKAEIMAFARTIGTYDISIQDAPDCCTVFQPSRPATKAFLPDLQRAEAAFDLETLVTQAVEGCDVLNFSCTGQLVSEGKYVRSDANDSRA